MEIPDFTLGKINFIKHLKKKSGYIYMIIAGVYYDEKMIFIDSGTYET